MLSILQLVAGISLNTIMQFITGSYNEPLLGFMIKPKIEFAENLSGFLSTANTGANLLQLPRVADIWSCLCTKIFWINLALYFCKWWIYITIGDMAFYCYIIINVNAAQNKKSTIIITISISCTWCAISWQKITDFGRYNCAHIPLQLYKQSFLAHHLLLTNVTIR